MYRSICFFFRGVVRRYWVSRQWRKQQQKNGWWVESIIFTHKSPLLWFKFSLFLKAEDVMEWRIQRASRPNCCCTGRGPWASSFIWRTPAFSRTVSPPAGRRETLILDICPVPTVVFITPHHVCSHSPTEDSSPHKWERGSFFMSAILFYVVAVSWHVVVVLVPFLSSVGLNYESSSCCFC